MDFIDTSWALTRLLVIARLAGMMAVAPVFGHEAVPLRLRVLLAVVASLAVVAHMPAPIAWPGSSLHVAVAIVGEIMLGLAAGLAAKALFVGLELAAAHVAQQSAVGLAEIYSAGVDGGGMMRRLFNLLAVVIFLAIGGHRLLLGAVLGSFATIAPGGLASPAGMLETLTSVLGVGFVLAVKVAAPVLVALLLATAVLGAMQRLVPQLNALSVGLEVRSVLALAVLGASLPALPGLVDSAYSLAQRQLGVLLEVL